MVSFARSPLPKKRLQKSVAPTRAISSNDESLTQKIFEAEQLRIAESPAIKVGLFNASPQIVRASLLAVGRIGDPSRLDQIEKILKGKNPQITKTALFALGLIRHPRAQQMLQQNSQLQSNPELAAAAWENLGRTGNKDLLQGLADDLAKEKKEEKNKKRRVIVLNGIALGIGHLLSSLGGDQPTPPEGMLADLVDLTSTPEAYSLAATYALARYQGPMDKLPVKAIREKIAAVPTDAARALLCRALGKVKSEENAVLLSELLKNDAYSGVRIEAAKALSGQPATESTIAATLDALSDKSSHVMVTILESIPSLSGTAERFSTPVEMVLRNHSSQWVRETALKTLARIHPSTARPRALEALNGGSNIGVPAAARALAIVNDPADAATLISLLKGPSVITAAAVLDGASGWSEQSFSDAFLSTLRGIIPRMDPTLTSLIADMAGEHTWTSFAPPLASVYPLLRSADQLDAKLSILGALKNLGNQSHIELLKNAMQEKDRVLVEAAAKALGKITNQDLTSKIPLNSIITRPPPPLSEAKAILSSRVVLSTSRGEIQFRFFPDAPANALNFVKLIRRMNGSKSFFDGTTFHRVVSNFVAQGGDPLGTGDGGPGYEIPDEWSDKHHTIGTIGMATSGKDTGGSQFFINTAPNLHLAGRYTLFGEVVRGLDVAEKLEQGDAILSVRLVPN